MYSDKTCRMETLVDVRFIEDGDDKDNYDCATLAECSACHAVVLMPPSDTYYDYELGLLYAETRYCPNCGARVVGVDE